MTREDAAAAEDFTVSDAIARYLTSQQTFGRLASATRKIHRSHLRRFAAAHGTTPFAAIDVDTIEGYLDQQMSAHVSRAAHKVLRALFRFGTKKMRWRADDPTKQIDARRSKPAPAGSHGRTASYDSSRPRIRSGPRRGCASRSRSTPGNGVATCGKSGMATSATMARYLSGSKKPVPSFICRCVPSCARSSMPRPAVPTFCWSPRPAGNSALTI